jgi:hypothetical protein
MCSTPARPPRPEIHPLTLIHVDSRSSTAKRPSFPSRSRVFTKTADAIRMTCENCGAAMHLGPDRLTMMCDYFCTGTAPPADDDGVEVADATSHLCPVCQAALANGYLGSEELLYCASCHGMRFEMQKLGRCFRFCASITTGSGARKRRGASTPAGSSTARCASRNPLCKQEPAVQAGMDKRPFHGGGNMHVDSCRPCICGCGSIAGCSAGSWRRRIGDPSSNTKRRPSLRGARVNSGVLRSTAFRTANGRELPLRAASQPADEPPARSAPWENHGWEPQPQPPEA